MYPVSAKFLAAISGSHQVIARARVVGPWGVFGSPRPFGVEPSMPGLEIPIIGGEVKMTAEGDIMATATLTTTPEYWEDVLPYGREIFLERGVDYGDGTVEYCPLGYYRIEKAVQDDAPHGEIKLDLVDRAAWIIQNRQLYPEPMPATWTHRQTFGRLVNGDPDGEGASTVGYGMFISDTVPIAWTAYDPDTAVIASGASIVEDSAFEYLAKIARDRGGQLRFIEDGSLLVEPVGGVDGPPVYTIEPGRNGKLIRLSRSVSRDGIYNVVSAYSTAAEYQNQVSYQFAYNKDTDSPLYWNGPFGVAPRFYASPLLTTKSAAKAAAATVLADYTDLRAEVAVVATPNPALRPYDNLLLSGVPVRAGDVTIPLTGKDPVQLTTLPSTVSLMGDLA